MPTPSLTTSGLVLALSGHHRIVKVVILGVLVLIVVAVAAVLGFALLRRHRQRRGRPDTGTATGAAGVGPRSSTPAITVHNLNKIYQMGKVIVPALDDVSLEISEGEMVCIMGKSGSGKSTLLSQLGLIDKPTSGTIAIYGQTVTDLSESERADIRLNRLGYVFQEYALLPELTAAENVYLPAMMLGKPAKDCRQRAEDLLATVGLESRATHRPKELSGGEQQRVAIARALVNHPTVIYADEPTANLDSISARTVMETLQELNQSLRVTVLFVSHDPDDAHYATQLIQLKDGKLTGDPA